MLQLDSSESWRLGHALSYKCVYTYVYMYVLCGVTLRDFEHKELEDRRKKHADKEKLQREESRQSGTSTSILIQNRMN